MKVLAIILGIVAVVVGGVLGFQYATKAQVIDDEAAIRFASYRQLENALTTGATPESWNASVFVTSKAFDKLLSPFLGTKVLLPAKGGLAAAEVVLDSLSLAWDIGALNAKLALTASAGAFPTKLGLVADALFIVKSIEPAPDDPDTVFLNVAPRIVSVRPSLKTPLMALTAGQKISDLIALGLTVALRDALLIRVPLKTALSYATSVNESLVTKLENGTNITFSITSPGETLKSQLRYRAIVTAGGMWALAKQAGDGDAVSDRVETPTEADKAKLDQMRAALANNLAAFAPRDTDLALYLSRSVLAGLADQYNSIDPTKRAITVQSTATTPTGKLYEDKWHDDVLGDGGVFIELTDANAAKATTAVGAVEQSWQGESGTFALSVPLQVAANANIHVHVDPLLGGGAGTTAGLVGSTSYTLKASAVFKRLDALGGDGIWLLPDIPCQNIPLTVRTDGTLKIGTLETEVPSIGANVHTTIGKDTLAPISVVDSIPRRFKLAPDKSESPPTYSVSYPSGADAMEIAFRDFKTAPSREGLWFGVNVDAKLVTLSQAPELSPTSAQLGGRVRDNLKALRPACAEDSTVEVLVGDVKIGPNNEFVKAFRNIGKALDDVRKTTEKAAADAAEAIRKAAADAAEAIRKGAEDAKNAVGKAGDDAKNAVGKAADDAKNAVGKAADDVKHFFGH